MNAARFGSIPPPTETVAYLCPKPFLGPLCSALTDELLISRQERTEETQHNVAGRKEQLRTIGAEMSFLKLTNAWLSNAFVHLLTAG